jgi:O-antigen/teichoic acid export membrane protein
MSDSPAVIDDLRSMVLKGGVFLFARQVASACLSFLGILIVTRIIGPESYGSYTTALAIAQYLQNLGQTGVSVFLVRHAGDISERQYRTASTFLLAVSLVVSLCLEIGADGLNIWVQVPDFTALLRTLAIFMPLQSLTAVASARVDRALNFRHAATIELIGQITYYVVALPAALWGYGAWSFVFAWVAQQIVCCVLLHIAARYVFAFAWDNTTIAHMLTYSLPFSAAAWLVQMRSLVNPLIVGHFLGAEAVAYVGLTVRLMELLATVKTITWRLSLAAFGRIQTQPDKLTKAINEAMQLQTLAIGPMLLAFSWFGGAILLMITGARWAPVIELFPFVAVAYLTNAQFNMHVSALQVLNHSLLVAIFAALNLVLFALGCAATVTQIGLLGYGWGEIIAIPSYLILHILVRRAIGRLQYRLSLIWWLGIAVGLFWRELGWWAIAGPFLALSFPGSIRQIKIFIQMFTAARNSAGSAPVAGRCLISLGDVKGTLLHDPDA